MLGRDRDRGGGLGLRWAITLSLIPLLAITLVSCSQTATHESGSVDPPEYSGVEEQGSATYDPSQDRAYKGGWAAKASFEGNTTAESHARGNFDVDVPDGYEGSYGAAFYFPPGTLSGSDPAQRGRIDVLRWDNERDDPSSDFGGIRISGSDHKARLVRGNLGNGSVETIGAPFSLQEGCWNWLFVHQKLSSKPSSDPAHAVNQVFLNGIEVVNSSAPNNYLSQGARQVRVGITEIDEAAQDVPLQFYVDDGYVGARNSSRVEPLSNACKPNVLFIITDDQRAEGTMDVMPNTRKWFFDGGTVNGQQVAGGTEFGEAFATTPECCPSRSSIMTGRYAHNHGVRTNPTDPGPLNQIRDSTVQRYLKRAGYRTGLFGKYLNGWDLNEDPPYFDQSGIFRGGWYGAYCPFYLKEKGQPVVTRGEAPQGTSPHQFCVGDYSTSYVGQKAVDFIQQAESNDSRPWFLYLAPYAPHEPPIPESKYSVWNYPRSQLPAPQPNPAQSETDLSDKPSWVSGWSDKHQIFDQTHNGQLYEGLRTRELRTLKSVDDLVDNVMTKLLETGEDQDTLAVFISDNGFMWREHGDADRERFVAPGESQPIGVGVSGKANPYTDSVKVPMFMRWPGKPLVRKGFTDQSLVGNVDLARTAMKVARISPNSAAGEPAMDGRTLIDPIGNRDRMLTEGWTDGVPPWASIRTPAYHYIEYYLADVDDPGTPIDESKTVTFREFYDLVADPFELTNIYPPVSPSPATLAAKLAADRTCTGNGCP
jgi:arylsulfatase A-like enzyme